MKPHEVGEAIVIATYLLGMLVIVVAGVVAVVSALDKVLP